MDEAEAVAVMAEGIHMGRAMKSTGGRKLLAQPPSGSGKRGHKHPKHPLLPCNPRLSLLNELEAEEQERCSCSSVS